MEFDDEKVAIITGASRGIGAGLVEAYRKHGYRVIANSRTITDSPHPEVCTVAGDIADPIQPRRDDSFRRRWHSLAGSTRLSTTPASFCPSPFIFYTREDYELVTSVNVLGFFEITQRAIAEMLVQGGGGHVLNITSILVEHALAGVLAALTTITKGGLAAVTGSLTIEYANHGIRVNAIPPGVVDTPMHASLDATARYAGMHPQNRIGAVADIVQGALYLETPPFVTGEILHVDGELSAGH